MSWITASLETVVRNAGNKIAGEIEGLNETIGYWSHRFYVLLKKPAMPGLLRVSVVSETFSGGKKMLGFSVLLPTPGASDVTKRELTVVIGGGLPDVKELEGSATEATGFTGEDNATVDLSLVDIDDAGNRSEARVQSFTLVDTLAPPMPNELGIRVDSET